MKGRYIIMLNLKKTAKSIKDNKKTLILIGGITLAGALMEVVLVKKVTNSIIKK